MTCNLKTEAHEEQPWGRLLGPPGRPGHPAPGQEGGGQFASTSWVGGGLSTLSHTLSGRALRGPRTLLSCGPQVSHSSTHLRREPRVAGTHVLGPCTALHVPDAGSTRRCWTLPISYPTGHSHTHHLSRPRSGGTSSAKTSFLSPPEPSDRGSADSVRVTAAPGGQGSAQGGGVTGKEARSSQGPRPALVTPVHSLGRGQVPSCTSTGQKGSGRRTQAPAPERGGRGPDQVPGSAYSSVPASGPWGQGPSFRHRRHTFL